MPSPAPTAVSFLLAIAFCLVATLIMGWDVYTAYYIGSGATVSAIIRGWAKAWPVLPLLVGLLMGHLFWPIYPSGPAGPWNGKEPPAPTLKVPSEP